MRLRLAGYARKWTPVSQEPTSRKALILGGIVVAHLAVIGVWLAAPKVLEEVWGIGEGSDGGTVEVVRFFDITPQAPTGAIQLSKQLADSLSLAASAGQ